MFLGTGVSSGTIGGKTSHSLGIFVGSWASQDGNVPWEFCLRFLLKGFSKLGSKLCSSVSRGCVCTLCKIIGSCMAGYGFRVC